MLKLRDGRFFISSEFQEVIDEFNKKQQERMRLLIELLNERDEHKKKKKNRRKMKKHGQKNIIS